ncbi:MAG: cupin domain-containing protein [Myxococcales bacterium]|nr:cupin domain-containing protein [Myxococcales bacterium]
MKIRTLITVWIPRVWIPAVMLAATSYAHSPEENAGVTIEPVLATVLAETADKHATVVRVVLEPGAVSAPHRHPGTVLVYVLQGEVVSALDDGEPQTFKAGEAWKEHPGALHRVAKNTTHEVAKLLAVLVHDEGAELQTLAE